MFILFTLLFSLKTFGVSGYFYLQFRLSFAFGQIFSQWTSLSFIFYENTFTKII